MTKAERKRTFKKAFTLYRRRGYDFSYRKYLKAGHVLYADVR